MVTKKKTKFFKSLRFRILVILLILGIVPSAIVTQLMISNYEKQAIEVKVSEVSTQCAILCNQIIKENYLNDSSSQSVNSKLELLSNVYGGRMVIVDRDLKVVADTYHVDEGRTLISPKVVKCFKNGEVTNYRRYGQMLEMAIPVKSADVPQIQGHYGNGGRAGTDGDAAHRNYRCIVCIACLWPFYDSGQTAGQCY